MKFLIQNFLIKSYQFQLVIQSFLMSQIVGKKVNNTVVFNVDGQPTKETKPQPLKNLIEKPGKPTKSVKAQVPTKQAISKEKPKEKPLQTPTQIPPQERPQRTFAPLSEQFPNLVRCLETKPEVVIKTHNRSSSSSSSYEDVSDEEEGSSSEEKENQVPTNQQQSTQERVQPIADYFPDEPVEEARRVPNPERHPKHAEHQKQRVKEIVQESNKQYKLSKEQVRLERARQLEEKLALRKSLQKQYGKVLSTSLKVQDQFQQKYSWGQNQHREKVEEEKLKSLRSEKEQSTRVRQDQRQQRKKVDEEIAQLFPESQNRESRFKKMWEQEARSCSRKHDPSSEPADTAYHSDKKVSKKPILDEKDREHVVRMIEENALKLTQQQRQARLEQKQKHLLKKHKIEYIDREAKEILKKTKKQAFIPDKGFENKLGPILQVEEDEQPPRVKSETSLSQLENFTGPMAHGGIVLSKQQAQRYKQGESKRKHKIEKFKSKLSHQQLKLKAADQYTRLEAKALITLKKEQKLEQQVEKAKAVQFKKMGIAVPEPPKPERFNHHQLTNDILDEAISNIPRLTHDEQDSGDENTDFKAMVEDHIRSKVFKQKRAASPKKPTPKLLAKSPKKFEHDIEDLRRLYEIKSDMPPPLELRKRAQKIKQMGEKKIKRVYKSQEPKNPATDPRYPVYHDLGETQLLEDDMYNAKYQIDQLWNTKGHRKPPEGDSDHDEEQEYVVKSGFFKDILPFSKVNQKSVREVTDKTLKRLRNKTVTFQDRSGYKTDESSKYIDTIEQHKQSLNQLISKYLSINHTQRQKQSLMQGKYTTDDDTDDDYMLSYSKQVWHTTDPISRDIFTLSAKELMQLPEINL